MNRFSRSFTICTWIKRVSTTSSVPVVFNYVATYDYYDSRIRKSRQRTSHDIITGSDGYYNRVIGEDILSYYLKNMFTTPVGQWFHYCLAWSLSSRIIRLYLDGELAATGHSGQTSTTWRPLYTNGAIRFNGLDGNEHNSNIFGGQLYQFNMYSEVLTSKDVKRIAEGGLCFDLEQFNETRILRWEDILTKSRTGSVVEVTGCDLRTGSETPLREQLETVTGQLNRTKDDLETVTGQLNRTQDELETVTSRLNRTEDELQKTKVNLETETARCNRTEDELQRTKVNLRAGTARCNRTEDELQRTKVNLTTETARSNQAEDELKRARVNLRAETARCNRTEDEAREPKVNLRTETARCNQIEGQLETCSSALTDTKSRLDGARKFQNITQWDILYTAPYYNNVLTEELFEQLKSSWDMLREFVGVNFTESMVGHFRKHDVDKAECGAQSDIFDMWGELIGVKMTWGIIQHFRENHNDVPCDD